MPNLLKRIGRMFSGTPVPQSRSLERLENITAADLLAHLGGTRTAAGVEISEKNALTISAVWAAVRIISQAVATLPLKVKRRTPDGYEDAENHPAYRLLTYRPNEYMTAFTLYDTLMGHVLLWGNAYARIKWANNNAPVSILPIAPTALRPERVAGKLTYRADDLGETFYPEEIIHIPGPGFDGLMGYSVVRMAREELGLGAAVRQYGSTYFGNGAQMKGTLEVPGAMQSAERIQLGNEFDRLYNGAMANKTAVLSNGTKYNRISMPPEDSQFLETRRFSVQDVSRWFNVPVHMLGDLERATFSNIEEQNLWFLQFCLTPWLTRIEQEVDYKLFGYGSTYQCQFDETELRRADLGKRQSWYASGRQWGYLTVNEIRAKEGLPRVPDGDILLQPVNMTTAKAASDPAPDPAPTKEEPGAKPDDEADEGERAALIAKIEPVLAEIVGRMNRKERNIRERQAGEKRLAHLLEHRQHVAAAFGPILSMLDRPAVAERMADAVIVETRTIDDAADLARLKESLK